MTDYDRILAGAWTLSRQDRLRLAHDLSRAYDGRTQEALAEAWAEDVLGMEGAVKAEPGIDGTLPGGRGLQVKSKVADAHPDAATYVTLSAATLDRADDLLVAFVDPASCRVVRAIGPVAIADLQARTGGRYHVNDMLRAGAADTRSA